MKFENAKRGLKMIYTAEICRLVAVLLSILAVSIVLKSPLAALIAGIAALVLVIFSTVKQVKGIVVARPDEKRFQYAMVAIIVWCAASVLSSVLPMIFPDMLNSVSHALGLGLLNIVVMVSVLQATSALFKANANEKLAKKGKIAITINVIAFWLENMVDALKSFAPNKTGLIVLTGIVYIVMLIIGYVKYLSYIKQAADKL